MDPANPMMSGVVQNQDSYMKGKIAQRWYYDRVERILEECFDLFTRKPAGVRLRRAVPLRRRGVHPRRHGLVTWRRPRSRSIISAGRGCRSAASTLCVPAVPGRQIVNALKNCTAFTVFERMDDPLSTTGNHLTREIKAAFCDANYGSQRAGEDRPHPADLPWRRRSGQPRCAPRRHHCRLPQHDETQRPAFLLRRHRSRVALKRAEDPDLRPKGGFSMRGHSVGGFGSVTTNKVIATIAGNVFGKDVQAYPKYGSEKKGLPTTYYLTIGDSHIYMHSELEHIDLLCINDPTAILNPHTLEGLQAGGAIFMQSPYAEPAEVWKHSRRRCRRSSGARIPHLLLRHGQDRPRNGVARPICKCACRASCSWARSSS